MAEAERGGRWKLWVLLAGVVGFIGVVATLLLDLDDMGFINARPGTPAERAAWARVSETSAEGRCEALREFLRAFPSGGFKDQAETLLAARTERQVTTWVSFAQPAVVVGTSGLEHRATREGACQSALESVQRNAESGCDLYRGDTERFRSVEAAMAAAPQCDCRDHAIRVEGGPEMAPVWRCSVRTSSHCRGETLSERPQEYCGE